MELKRWLQAQWDRAAAVASVLIGALALLIGYYGVRDALYPGEQIPYVISGGLFGLFAVGLGAVLWLSADLRDEWRKLDDIHEAVTELVSHTRASPAPTSTADVVPSEQPTASANGERRQRLRAR